MRSGSGGLGGYYVKKKRQKNIKNNKNIGLFIILMVLVISIVNIFLDPSAMKDGDVPVLSYSNFITEMNNGKLAKVVINRESIEASRKDGTKFTTYILDAGILPSVIAKAGVDVTVEPPEKKHWFVSMLVTIFPSLLFIGFLILFTMKVQGRAFDFGKSKSKSFEDNREPVTFDDVAGCDEAKEELVEIVDFLKEPKKYTKLGARIPRGVLLLGAPGTGKTLLARAIAGQAGVPFYSVSGSGFVEMFVGVGASRVRDLFEHARQTSPCIIFVDEIDAVGRHRGAGLGGGHDEREQTLNQLLVEMDGFASDEEIIIIAATNRPDILDPALLRPGRFDRQVVVDEPDVNGREAILKVHTRNKKLAPDVKLDVLAKRTPGFVGADLANLVNEAALLSARHNKDCLNMPEFEEAIDRVIAGPERHTRLISEEERTIIAYHEAGHALVAANLKTADPVHKISIVPRGHAALGLTWQLPKEDRFLKSKQKLLDEITVLFGGRVAEMLTIDSVTTGAANDLERATKLARNMVTQWGMSDGLGLVTLGKQRQEVFLGHDIIEDTNYSGETAKLVDKEIKGIIDGSMQQAKQILTEHRAQLDKIKDLLLEKEILEGNELNELLGYPVEKVASTAENEVNANDASEASQA